MHSLTTMLKRCIFVSLFLLVLADSALCIPGKSAQKRKGIVSRMYIWKNKSESDQQNFNTYCFKKECRCQETKADCSQNYGNLTFVPKLPETVQFLNFSYNNLTTISSGDFFANVSQLRALDLGDNNLMSIHPTAFQVFTNLSHVFLDYNFNLTIEAMDPILSTSTLTRLDLRHGGLVKLPNDVFFRHPLHGLKTLYLHDNQLVTLNFTALTPLRKLSNLGLANNKISQVHSDMMPELKRLNLQGSALFQFPETCTKGSSLFPRLTDLFLSHSLISTITGPVCLPRLEILELSSNLISHFHKDMFGQDRFPSLVSLQLQSQTTHGKTIEAYAFRNPSVRLLNLMYNDLSFGNDIVVSPDCFNGSSNLRDLQLSHNFFNYVTRDKWQLFFNSLQKLEKLYLGDVMLNNLSRDALMHLSSLRKLDLYENNLSELPDGVFDGAANLTILGLEMNQIPTIKESTFSASTRNRLTALDLSGNPFRCWCDLLWFQAWFLSNPALFAHSETSYRCKNLAGMGVGSFIINPQACLLSHDAYTFIVTTISMVMVVMALVTVLYRYRWHIRLLLYEAFRGRDTELRQRRLQEQHFDYDVFVSYAIQDCDWVLTRLRPQLEDVWGLRLCLHQRDFLPGKNIADNIADSVQASKKVLMLFSTSFARSPWCQFELAFCLRHVIDYDDALMVVRLHEVASRDLTSTMVAVHKTTTYIQWGEGPEVEASFWGRLQIALGEVWPQ